MVTICMLNKDGEEIPTDIIAYCVYYFHKTFENTIQKYTEPLFTIIEEGWDEFDMKIVCKLIAKATKLLSSMIYFFQDSAYAVDYTVQVPLNIAKLRAVSQINFVLSDNSIEDQTKNNKPRLN